MTTITLKKKNKLIEGILNRDENTYRELLSQYQGIMAHVIVSRRVKNDVFDIIQDVFTDLPRLISTYDVERDFGNWIITVAANKATDFVRKNNRINYAQPEYFETLFDKTNTKAFEGNVNNVEMAFLRLFFLHGLSIIALAKMFDVSERSMRRYKAALKQKIIKSMGGKRNAK